MKTSYRNEIEIKLGWNDFKMKSNQFYHWQKSIRAYLVDYFSSIKHLESEKNLGRDNLPKLLSQLVQLEPYQIYFPLDD